LRWPFIVWCFYIGREKYKDEQKILRKPHIVLFSDTGGGHRSAAEAIIEAVHLAYKIE
jgi:hypothetical protein